MLQLEVDPADETQRRIVLDDQDRGTLAVHERRSYSIRSRANIRAVAADTQAGERYASQVGELWSGLSLTLAQLEAIAGSPERLDDERIVEVLRSLQYRLHTAGESVVGLSPPADSEHAHTELEIALEGARDATAEVIDAIDEDGPGAADTIVHEWRGALFRVRLAQLRLTGGRKSTADPQPLTGFRAPLIALILTAGGAAAFAYGATAGPWPIWVAGMIAVCASLLSYRP